MISIPRLSDLHVHFRQGDLLRQVAPMTDRYAAYALAMPNTEPPITCATRARDYLFELTQCVSRVTPLVAFKLTGDVLPEELRRAGAVAGKLYPEGVTTNSEGGVTREALLDPDSHPRLRDALRAMEDNDVILSIHGELPGAFCMDAEAEFLPFVDWVLATYPRLRVVLEHITLASTVKYVLARPRLAATITAHHLLITLDDVVNDGGRMRPHSFCKPVAKRPEDRLALRSVVLAGERQFFLGSDSAPHVRSSKECASCCAGVLTAPILPELLAQFFGSHRAFSSFASTFGNQFYGLRQPTESIELRWEPWVVPQSYGDLVPFWAGRTLNWRAC